MNRLLDQFGLIQITGVDTQKFLQGQLTADVSKLGPKQFTLSAHCNPQGRIISLFHLMNHDNSYYLFLHKSTLEIAINALKKYAVFYKTTLEDASKQLQQENLAALANQCLQQIIDLNIPILYAETSGKFLPHELNLQHLNAIDFNKGCYTGQEIIARMHYRGKLKNTLHCYQLQSEDDIAPGTDIYIENQACGTIVNIWEDDAAMFALCVMHESNYQQTEFIINNKILKMQLITQPESL